MSGALSGKGYGPFDRPTRDDNLENDGSVHVVRGECKRCEIEAEQEELND